MATGAILATAAIAGATAGAVGVGYSMHAGEMQKKAQTTANNENRRMQEEERARLEKERAANIDKLRGNYMASTGAGFGGLGTGDVQTGADNPNQAASTSTLG